MTTIAELIATHTPDLGFLRPFYEDLHETPELSGMERRTAARVEKMLQRFDCEIITGIGGFGLVGIFRNGEGPTALMRADFDALPVKEETGLPFQSTRVVALPDGSASPVMHACGHDLHTSALLGVCATLDQAREAWSGTFVALFQPSEENSRGADAMIADGLADLIPAPDVCFGQHVMPGRAGEVQTMPGGQMAGCDSIRITITGRGGHGSMPHKGIDPTFVAAMIVVRLQGIVGREIDPNDFAVVTVGTLRSGNTNNTIPGEAELVLNCRFYDEDVKRRLYRAIRRVVAAECEASGCPEKPRFEYFAHGEITDNTPEVFSRVRPIFDDVFGANSVTATRSTASEDFSHIPRAFNAPYMYWFIGCTPAEQWDRAQANGTVDTDVPVNHTSTYLPDYEPSINSAVRAGAAACLTYLRRRPAPSN